MNSVPAVSEVEPACGPYAHFGDNLHHSPANSRDCRLESEHKEPPSPSFRINQRFLEVKHRAREGFSSMISLQYPLLIILK